MHHGHLKHLHLIKGSDIMNKLNGLRCYLAGPIDHAEDDGIGWRREIGEWLRNKGVVVMDPTDKPTSQTKFKEIEEEKTKLIELKRLGRWAELRGYMKEIVLADLRMVEISDFNIVYIDTDVHLCGTYEELFVSLRQRKPTFVVAKNGKESLSVWLFGRMNPDFIFDSFETMLDYLNGIDVGLIEPDTTRWVFFDHMVGNSQKIQIETTGEE